MHWIDDCIKLINITAKLFLKYFIIFLRDMNVILIVSTFFFLNSFFLFFWVFSLECISKSFSKTCFLFCLLLLILLLEFLLFLFLKLLLKLLLLLLFLVKFLFFYLYFFLNFFFKNFFKEFLSHFKNWHCCFFCLFRCTWSLFSNLLKVLFNCISVDVYAFEIYITKHVFYSHFWFLLSFYKVFKSFCSLTFKFLFHLLFFRLLSKPLLLLLFGFFLSLLKFLLGNRLGLLQQVFELLFIITHHSIWARV